MYRKTSMDLWTGPRILWSRKLSGSPRTAVHKTWISGSGHPWSLPLLSKKIKMAGDQRSVSHGSLDHEFSGPVNGPDLFCLRRKKINGSPQSKSHRSLDRAMNSAVQSMVHIFPVSKTLCKPLLLMLTKICSCRETCGKRLFRSLYRNYPILLLSYINSSC